MKLSKRDLIIIAISVIAVVVLITGGYFVYRYYNENEANDTTAEEEVKKIEEVSVPTVKDCVGDGCLEVSNLEYPVGQLPVAVSSAVRSALDDEYKAFSVYEATIAKLGSIRPFSMIIRAEESHIAQLKAVLDKYGETIPTNPYNGKITAEATKQEACQTGVDAEIANVALYRNELLPKVAAYPDITSVFNSLMNASQDKHLPSFEKCN